MIKAYDILEMFKEIREVNVKLGWQPHNLTNGEVLALLHSEVSEALDAWRVGGFKDQTMPGSKTALTPPKPEGVGSELADVLIRWIDNLDMFGILPSEVRDSPGLFGMTDKFAQAANNLHDLISRFSIALDSYLSCPLLEEVPELNVHYHRIFWYLLQMSAYYGIDLPAEYERKLAYNKTRGYRHGGKRL